MKKLLLPLVFIISFSLFGLTQAGEFTGIGSTRPFTDKMNHSEVFKLLRKHGISRNDISDGGMKILLGEFTGIGKKVNIENIRMILTKKELFFIEDVEDIRLRNNHAKPVLSNVSEIQLKNISLTPNKIKALIVK